MRASITRKLARTRARIIIGQLATEETLIQYVSARGNKVITSARTAARLRKSAVHLFFRRLRRLKDADERKLKDTCASERASASMVNEPRALAAAFEAFSFFPRRRPACSRIMLAFIDDALLLVCNRVDATFCADGGKRNRTRVECSWENLLDLR